MPVYSMMLAMAMQRPQVLYEDNHLLVVNKPPGLATMGVTADRPTLVRWAKDYLKRKYHKPGNVYLGVVSRLDAPVSGVVVLARTSKAAARLTAQFGGRRCEKTYWAIVEGKPADEGRLIDWLVRDEQLHRVKRLAKPAAGAQQAELSFRRLGRLARGTWLEVRPETGRKHQIRVQLAAHGMPIAGDRKYGSRLSFGEGIALHARRLQIEHPTTGQRLVFEAAVPAAWRQAGVEGRPGGG